MADDLTLGELARNVERLERAHQQLATDTVPAKLWAAQHKSLEDDLAEHVRQAVIDRERLERELADLRKTHERDTKTLRDALEKEIEQARRENKAQVEALKAEREKRSEFTWQRALGVLTVAAALAGVIVAALAASKGIH